MKSIHFLPVLILIATAVRTAENIFTIERTATGGADIKIDGKPFASYVIDQANKPYLFPVYGPTGKAMTRAYPMQQVEGEQTDHPHHRGINFGHEHISGIDTWAERASFDESLKIPKREKAAREGLAKLGTEKHREYTKLEADGEKAVIAEICDYLDSAGKRILTEERRMTFRVVAGTRVIDFDQDLIASDGPVKFDDSKDAGLSIRVPSSMAVDSKQGGQLINSEGITDADAWNKPAKWCDYHGPVEGEQLGIAMLNHPSSFRYPTRWHVRTYGLFTANAFGSHGFNKELPDVAFELKSGERLKLRHRFIFHKGDEKAAKIAEAFDTYSAETR